jgi:hypothetical protein
MISQPAVNFREENMKVTHCDFCGEVVKQKLDPIDANTFGHLKSGIMVDVKISVSVTPTTKGNSDERWDLCAACAEKMVAQAIKDSR